MKIDKAVTLVIIQFMLFGIFLVLLLLPRQSVGIVQVTGIVLAIVGPIFALASIREHSVRNAQLPKVVPTPGEQSALVASGPYHYIRHPIYTGVLLTAFGAAIAHGHAALLVMAIIMLVFFYMKSSYEEKLLQSVYPTYAAYKERTGRFLPRLT